MTLNIDINTINETIEINSDILDRGDISRRDLTRLVQKEVDKALNIDAYRSTILIVIKGAFGGWGRQCTLKILFDLVDSTATVKTNDSVRRENYFI